jgi:hypothetical protein
MGFVHHSQMNYLIDEKAFRDHGGYGQPKSLRVAMDMLLIEVNIFGYVLNSPEIIHPLKVGTEDRVAPWELNGLA